MLQPWEFFDENEEFYGTIEGWPCVRVKNRIVQQWMLGLGWHWTEYAERQTILGENFKLRKKDFVEKLIAQEEAKLPEFVKSQYELALKIATEAHKGQKDKGGANYILHPLKVAELCPHDICKVIALLHDEIEDCGLTTTELDEKGIYPIIHGRVKLLTHQEGQTYQEYLEAIAEDPYAREVKIADLTHNMDLSRIPNPTEKDFERVEKYKKALAFLRSINY